MNWATSILDESRGIASAFELRLTALVLAAAICAPAQDRPESFPAPIADLPAALASFERADRSSRSAALDAIDAILHPVTENAGLETLGESLPTSRVARNIIARQGIALVTKKVPLLLAALGDEDPVVRRKAATILGRMRWWGRAALTQLASLLQDPDLAVRREASWALAEIAPDDPKLAAPLAAALSSDDADVRENVARALGRMGVRAASAVPALQAALADARESTRIQAASALGAIGFAAGPALDALIVAARDDTPRMRASALWALRKIHDDAVHRSEVSDDPERLARLAGDLLDDPEVSVREQAAWLVGSMSYTGKFALPKLLRSLRTATGDSRAAIVWAISRIGPETEDAVVPLAKALSDPNPNIRQNAASALCGLGPKAEAAVPDMIRALADDRKITRINVVSALGAIGAPAKDSVPALLRMLDTTDSDVIDRVVFALHAIDPDSDAPLSKLMTLLESDQAEMRASAASALASYGPRARGALPGLARMLHTDRARTIGRDAAMALVAIDRTGTVAIPALCDATDNVVPAFKNDIAGWIKDYGLAARPFGPCLVKMLVATRDSSLMDVLAGLGLDPKELVPALEEILVKLTDDSSESFIGFRVFVRADPRGTIAIPRLIRLLGHDVRIVRAIAEQELVPFGPKGKDAIPSLLKIFRDAGRGETAIWERRAALFGLAAIGPAARPETSSAIDLLSTLSPADRQNTLVPIARLDPDSPRVVAFIAAQLSEERLLVEAARTLELLGPKAAAAVPALLNALTTIATKTGTNDARARITSALGAIGPAAAAARPILINQLIDPDPYLAPWTRTALISIGCPLSPEEIGALAETLRKEPGSQDAVLAALRLGLADTKLALPALIAALELERPSPVEAVCWAIGRLGPEAASAVPTLTRMLDQALGLAKKRDPGLTTGLTPSETTVIDAVLSALASIGPGAKSALPSIQRVPGYEKNSWVRRRIEPPKRKPLAIVVDPSLVLPVQESPEKLNFGRRIEREPDGSFRVGLGSGDGMSGTWVSLFLAREAQGQPRATADWSFYTDVSSACRGPEAVEAGTLTLMSGDWGSGKPIIGILRLNDDDRDGFPFEVPDPFAATESRPK